MAMKRIEPVLAMDVPPTFVELWREICQRTPEAITFQVGECDF
jgi:hypothetical protein